MSAHTPGPWEIVPADHDNSFIRPCGKKIVICETYTYLGDDNFERANARLIAAAPDLLAALKALDVFSGGPLSEHDRAVVNAAIAKAEGRA